MLLFIFTLKVPTQENNTPIQLVDSLVTLIVFVKSGEM